MSSIDNYHDDWHAEYFAAHKCWDVTRGPADDASERFSVIEELTESDAKLIAASHKLLEACCAVLAALEKEAEETGHILWLDPPYVLPGVHVSAIEMLQLVIDEAMNKAKDE